MTVINWFYNNYDLMRNSIKNSEYHLRDRKVSYDSSDTNEEESDEQFQVRFSFHVYKERIN